ncbi:MAG: sigma-70 family RNA polymerase sigma factor [Eubacterium sp.]|nr:sigma-70 family RNA polymerase sigma factor [Eubacterium sp.]
MKNTVSLKLVEKAAKGNKEAFGELIIMHQEYLYKLAYLYTKNEQDALDAVQECAMRAMISMDKLREPQYFKTWITRILINSIYKAQKKCRHDSPFEAYHEAMSEQPLSIEEKTDLYDAIDLLPTTYKTVVILQYFEGMKLKDIAQVMNVPEGSVKAYLFRAREMLRNRLEDDEERHRRAKSSNTK